MFINMAPFFYEYEVYELSVQELCELRNWNSSAHTQKDYLSLIKVRDVLLYGWKQAVLL